MNTPKRPMSSKWKLISVGLDTDVYQLGNCTAFSSIIYARQDKDSPLHWQWLVSFSENTKKPIPNNRMKKYLKSFGCEKFEEDNHEDGVVRKFFLAVDKKFRKPCPCKDEIVIKKGDYVYSQKIEK